MKLLTVILAASAAAVALAGCPGGCSGHGTCGAAEMCTCEAGFTGLDCAKRECPYGLSWTSASDSGVVPGGRGLGGSHPYTECSSAGECDYSSGTCSCYDGYEGRGCRMKKCPNDCSGHGKCMSNFETSTNHTAFGGASFNTLFRDFLATRQCTCDRGFKGADCSQRICPKGDDPITDCGTDAAGAAHEMIQRIYVRTLKSGANGETDGQGNCANQCDTGATSCSGYYECDAGAADHSYCTEGTRWYANEALCGTTAAAGTAHATETNTGLNNCNANLGAAATNNAIFGGYIALKYTDMFGGVYKTRPILIDNQCRNIQFVAIYDANFDGTYDWEHSGTFYEPDSSDYRALQYGGLGEPLKLKDDSASLGTGDISSSHVAKGAHEALASGQILKLAHDDAPSANSQTLYDQLRNGRLRYTADRIRAALQELPNFAIPSVNVTNYYMKHDSQNTIFTNVFDVTFTSEHTAGKQPLLECIYKQESACEGAFPRLANSGKAIASAACSPADSTLASTCNEKYFPKIGSLNVQSCTVEEVHPGTKTYEENSECSNRGICDTSTGVCDCFDGHSGEACQTQTVFF